MHEQLSRELFSLNYQRTFKIQIIIYVKGENLFPKLIEGYDVYLEQ